MSIGDAVKNLIGIDDEADEEKISKNEVKEAKDKLKKEKDKNKHIDETISAGKQHSAPEHFAPSAPQQKTPAVERRFSVTNTGAFKLVLIEPKSFEECPKLVDSLKAHKPIIINLEHLSTDVARKIFDFLSGATYALDGNVQKIASNIFVFAPQNVDIAGGKRMSDESRFDFTNGGDKTKEKSDPATDPDNPWR